MNHMILLGFLVILAIGILVWETSARETSAREGFQDIVVTGAKCAQGYTFFNDKHGNSMCCRGTVNPITHECMNTTSLTDICSFSERVPDPRDPSRTLSSCAETIRREYASLAATHCPKQFPFYAKNDRGDMKCCKHATINNGTDCTSENISRKDYCMVSPKVDGIPTCASMQLEERNVCPTGFQASKYTLGETETKQYNVPLSGHVIPTCTTFQESCITPAVLKELKSKGMFANKKADEWKYSCLAWERQNLKRDQTFTMDTSYP